jgi:hypothetical protein
VIADAGMVAQSVLKQFDCIVWRFRLDDGNARIVIAGGNASVFNGVSLHGVSVFYSVRMSFIRCPRKRTNKQAKKRKGLKNRPEYRTSGEKVEMITEKEIEREIQRVRDRLKSLAGEEYGGQSELARGIGVPRQRLFDWITGKSTPDVKAWLRIQAYLKIDGKKRATMKTTNQA